MTLGKAKHVYSRDPALDRNDPKCDEALRHTNETGERNGLPLKDGRLPAVWHLRSLTMRGYEELSNAALFDLFQKLPRGASALGDQAAFSIDRTAVRHGLVSVEGATDLDGRPIALEFEDVNGEKALTRKSLEALYERYRPALINELGRRIVEISTLDPQ